MDSFSWLLDRRLAGMARPGRSGPLAGDLDFLRRQGVTAVVSLIEPPTGLAEYAEAGFRAHHIPLRNFGVPSRGQIETFCRLVDEEVARGGAVATHCQFGVGRTGVMLIAYGIHRGLSFDEAVAEVVRTRGSAPTGSPERDAVLREFEALVRAERGG